MFGAKKSSVPGVPKPFAVTSEKNPKADAASKKRKKYNSANPSLSALKSAASCNDTDKDMM